MRRGWLNVKLCVDPPDFRAMEDILKIYTRTMTVGPSFDAGGIAWMVSIFDMTLWELNWQHLERWKLMRSDFRLRVRRSDGYSVPQRRMRAVIPLHSSPSRIPSQRKNPTWTFPSFFGHKLATSLVRSQVQTDPGSYILITPGTMGVKGVFAAGDVQNRQVVCGCDWD